VSPAAAVLAQAAITSRDQRTVRPDTIAHLTALTVPHRIIGTHTIDLDQLTLFHRRE
jgi:hypothetical protein